MLIGITGTDGAGKGEVVDYLVKKRGFVHYSAREILEKEIKKRGIKNNRANMRVVANCLRSTNGNDFLITYYLEKIKTAKPKYAIIESIRTIDEVNSLKKNGGVLLAVDANPKLRYKRIQARGSSTDAVSFEEFRAHEELENNDPHPNGMQKADVIKMADYVIMNEGTLNELHQNIKNFLDKFSYNKLIS